MSVGLDTYYAVQNASLTESAYIEVVYRDTNGATVATDGRYLIGPGGKRSIVTCAPSDGTDMTNFTGSAVISGQRSDWYYCGSPCRGDRQSPDVPGCTSIPGTVDAFNAFEERALRV